MACPDSGGPAAPRPPRAWLRPGGRRAGLATGPQGCRPVAGFRLRGSRQARTGYQELNAKIVVDVNVFPGPSVVDGKDGSLGESGKCWVSKVYPAPCR